MALPEERAAAAAAKGGQVRRLPAAPAVAAPCGSAGGDLVCAIRLPQALLTRLGTGLAPDCCLAPPGGGRPAPTQASLLDGFAAFRSYIILCHSRPSFDR